MLASDAKHAVRVYARTPGASLVAIVVLAVAMAFFCAFLSLYVDLAVRPHAGFEDAGALVTIGQNDGAVFDEIPAMLIDRIDEEAASLEAVAGYLSMAQKVGPARESQTIEVVTRQFFPDMRPRLALGRGFDESDHTPGAEPVAVVSDRYWRKELGGDPAVIDRFVEITGRVPSFLATDANDRTTSFRIVGVMSPALPSLFADDAAMWLPYESAAPLYLGRIENNASARQFRGIGRLADGATVAAVIAELNDRWSEDISTGIVAGFRLDAVAGIVPDINIRRETERQLALFLAGSVLLALVAAANVSLFLVSRAPSRRRELGIRMAVGASTRRLARQLVTEAGLLVAVASALGVLLSLWLGGYLESLSFLRQARWRDVSPFDWRVLALAVAFVAVLSALVSLAPVLGLKRVGIGASSRFVSSRASATQRLASTAQLAMAGVVGAAALAFVWQLVILLTADPGYETRDILVVTPSTEPAPGASTIGLNYEGLQIERERRRNALLGIPGVEAVGFSSGVPGLDDRVLRMEIENPMQPGELVQLEAISADRGYFEILGLAFTDGGPWEEGRAEVLIVNGPAAEELWGRSDVAGDFLPGTNTDSGQSEVAGVVAAYSLAHPAAAARAQAYVPIFFYSAYEHIVVRTGLSASELREAVEALIAGGELEFILDGVRPLDAVVDELVAPDRARALLAVTAAVLVLFVAAFGFYGTQQFLVSAGRREYAIRAALGAGPGRLGRLVLRRGLDLALPGLIAAGLLAVLVAGVLRGDFVARDVAPAIVAAGVVAGLIFLVFGASLAPMRLVRRTEPAPLLRQD